MCVLLKFLVREVGFNCWILRLGTIFFFFRDLISFQGLIFVNLNEGNFEAYVFFYLLIYLEF